MKTTKKQRIYPKVLVLIFGILILMVSFGMLNSNESLVDYSRIAKKAKEINTSEKAPEKHDNKLVYVSGALESKELIGDTFLVAGKYISIIRKVEMYSWKEHTTRKTGSNSNRGKEYKYRKVWASRPANSSKFKRPDSHFNPKKIIQNNEVKAKTANIGEFAVDMEFIELPEHDILAIGSNNAIERNELNVANSKYLFKGNGTYDNPEIGDIRISYLVLKSPLKEITLFGKLDLTNQQIAPYYKGRTKFYRVLYGSKNQAIKDMGDEYIQRLWMFRGIGFLLLFFSLLMLLSSVGNYLNGFSVFGSTFRIKTGLFIFLLSLVLTTSIILLANIALWGSYLVFVFFIFVMVGIFRFLKRTKRQRNERLLAEEKEKELA
ncbi:MAG: TMEM43 family protein [Brumimicrobium sp.]